MDFHYLIARQNNFNLLCHDGKEFQGDEATIGALLRGLNGELVVLFRPNYGDILTNFSGKILDFMVLYFLIYPNGFCVPTIDSVAHSMDFDINGYSPDSPKILQSLTNFALAKAKNLNSDGVVILNCLNHYGWGFAPHIQGEYPKLQPVPALLALIDKIKEWEFIAPKNSGSEIAITDQETFHRLLTMRGMLAEERPSQKAYSLGALEAFQPRRTDSQANIIIAEAGTGTGKTYGYLSPASLFAEKNLTAVFVATFTRHLQDQVADELVSYYKDNDYYKQRVVIRKGRENYLCLLNLEESLVENWVDEFSMMGNILMVWWLIHHIDGDIQGGNMPSWLSEILPNKLLFQLRDKRGECLHSACRHFKKCAIERNIRQSDNADIVITNHSLMLLLAEKLNLQGEPLPKRIIFDEAHHLFQAADSAFNCEFSLNEIGMIKLWLVGDNKASKYSRLRGLRKRMENMVIAPKISEILDELQVAAQNLPDILSANDARKPPSAATNTEKLLRYILQMAQNFAPNDFNLGYNNEIEMPITLNQSEIKPLILAISNELQLIIKQCEQLHKALKGEINQELLDASVRDRMQSMQFSLESRVILPLKNYESLLQDIANNQNGEKFCDWYSVNPLLAQNSQYALNSVGIYRHYINPAEPMAKLIYPNTDGVLLTSATLRTNHGKQNLNQGWDFPKKLCGLNYLPNHDLVGVGYYSSPFDYKNNLKIIVVNDLEHGNDIHIAKAMAKLFTASGGGAIGLFTSILRLRKSYDIIKQATNEMGVALYAQHKDAMNLTTMIDLFRYQQHACMLGTDSLRDGIDVPGDSLRLLVFDKVPWPRPTLLQKSRYNYFGKEYQDYITMQRLAQATGRLIRRDTDKGIFIMLDSRMPSRFATAFPQGVEIMRLSIMDTLNIVENFFKNRQN